MGEKVIDQTVPDGRWAFDAKVTDAFDDMLQRSVPDYRGMRSAVFDMGSRFVQKATSIVDVGCSRGEGIAPFVDRFGARNNFVLVDTSGPMLEAVRERFCGWIEAGIMRVKDLDLRNEYPPVRASLTLSVLTLQFTPIEHRPHIVRRMFEATAPGGALILVEKILVPNAELDELFVKLYREMKKANGYTEEAILRKALALEGVLVPVTAKWNEELLREAGFSRVECFWRWFNFAGWVAVR